LVAKPGKPLAKSLAAEIEGGFLMVAFFMA